MEPLDDMEGEKELKGERCLRECELTQTEIATRPSQRGRRRGEGRGVAKLGRWSDNLRGDYLDQLKLPTSSRKSPYGFLRHTSIFPKRRVKKAI